MILTDRSRIESYLNCPRQRYLGYEWSGIGLDKIEPSLPLLTGIAIHSAVDKVSDDPDSLERILEETIYDWKQTLSNPDEWFILEQQVMLEGLIRTWTTYRLPMILEEFSVVASEVEIPWNFGPDLTDMVRCDKILRDSFGNLKILELKTASNCGDQWINGWKHNTQILANTLAVKETFGEECDGVMIEGLCKGMRKFDKKLNRIIQLSPLCYGWKKIKDGSTIYSPKYSAGWERFPVWQEFTALEWFQNYIDEDIAREICVPIPAIKPTTFQLERWRKQTIHQETTIRSNRDNKIDIDHAFPMNDSHCLRYWGYPCKFEEICFNEEVSNDPIGSGIYRLREPHHGPEREAWEKARLEKENQQTPGATEAAELILGLS